MQYQTQKIIRENAINRRVLPTDMAIFATSSISGYSYFSRNANITGHVLNRRLFNIFNENIIKDIWTLVSSPAN